MIRTLVVDDEPLAGDLVQHNVEQNTFLTLAGRCYSAKEAYERIQQGGVDLLFLDVQMPGMSGLTLMKSIENTPTKPKVVFTTAFSEYAIDGFKLDAVDYLLKPFDFDEFMKAALKAQHIITLEQQSTANGQTTAGGDAPQGTEDEESHFFVKSEYKLVRIDVSRITHIEGLKDYIKIYLDGEQKPVLTLMSLKEMESKLPPDKFARLHRSFRVNMTLVKGIERSSVTLATGVLIPIGDGYKNTFMQKIEQRIL